MMKSEYVKSNALCRSVTKRQPTGQGLNIADNCPYKVSQAKLIRVVQRAAKLMEGQTIPDRVRNFRKNNMSLVHSTKLGSKIIHVGGKLGCGFGMNAGCISSEYTTIFNEYNGVHTEPRLITKKYGGWYGRWKNADQLIAKRVSDQSGLTKSPFYLFTERPPCPDCTLHFNKAIYKANDEVRSYFASGVTSGDVAKEYIPEAEMKFPDYSFSVERGYPDGLTGRKKIVSPKIQTATK